MGLTSKLRAAATIVKTHGVGTFVRECAKRYLGGGTFRPDECLMVFELLNSTNRNGIMIDVGAHFGSSLDRFARAGWTIFAFEPDPENRKKLESAFGTFPNVHIDRRGVSDESRQNVPFYTSAVSTGISGLSAFHSSHVSAGTIDITTLSGFCSEHSIRHVDFLKIDTEGFDLPVLRSHPWSVFAPAVIVCEFEDSKTKPLGYSFHDLARFIQSKGYRLLISEWKPVQQYGGLHDWNRFSEYPCELSEEKAWGNIIATNSEFLYKALLTRAKRP